MQGILFDLDGTLLDIDLESFLERYFSALGRALEPLTTGPDGVSRALAALNVATHAMVVAHPGRTNREIFHEKFLALTGIDLDEHSEVFTRFYAEEFPLLGDGFGPAAGARDAVERALELDLRVAIATNPIFPLSAVEHRIAWAGLGDLPLHAVTTYETMHACKPLPEYYRETAELIGVAPERCLMVGDDRVLDLPAASTGMRTYYVGPEPAVESDFSGDLVELARILPLLGEDW